MASILEQTDMRDVGAVIAALQAGARACREAKCRQGSIEVVEARPEDASTPAGMLIATGDLHDNPLHLARIAKAAGILSDNPQSEIVNPKSVSHLTLHELIHGERLINGLDYSYRVLVRAAALKTAYPERVHVLLANHEIAQLVGSPVMKEGVQCNEAFDEALDATFGDRAESVREAIRAFIRALPLALRIRRPNLHDILCAHSLPAPALMERFDLGVLERGLSDADFQPRTGSAYLMSWGRAWTPEHLQALGQRWNVGLFILGHEKAETGCTVIAPNTVVLNSDHERGVYARLDIMGTTIAAEVEKSCERLAKDF